MNAPDRYVYILPFVKPTQAGILGGRSKFGARLRATEVERNGGHNSCCVRRIARLHAPAALSGRATAL